ncbi:MAG: cation transporter, partial [Magnetococcales bacterium]|nr:cation transporter [Magnetococcales bacterium]
MTAQHALWCHDHIFGLEEEQAGESRTRWVIALTLVMMVVELVVGYLTGSMALTADGWHMSTHASALAISALAYAFTRKQARNPRFTFGTGKVGILGAFASAVILAMVAALMAAESIARLLNPTPIQFRDAIVVAVAGLVVNLVSALLLSGGHGHSHGLFGHDHGDHDHAHPHDDHAHPHEDHAHPHDDHAHPHDDHAHPHDD